MPEWRAEVRRALARLNLELAREESIAEELVEHLEERYDELLRRGCGEDEAYRTTLQELDEEKLRTELVAMFQEPSAKVAAGANSASSFWSGLSRDVRLAWRQMRLNPAFALVAILSLALGVGANTAIFELIDAVVLRTLPVPDPGQLAEVRLTHEGRVGTTVARQKDFSIAIWDQLRQQQRGFSKLAAWSTEGFDLAHGGEARNADGMWVSGTFFDVLALKPALGRLLSPSDDVKGCGIQGAVISYGFWQREYGGGADVIGRAVSLDRHAFQIIGVTPQTFTGLEVGRKFDVAVPLCSETALHADDAWSNSDTTWWLNAIGRLKPGWSRELAMAQLATAAPGIFSTTLPGKYDPVEKKAYLNFGFRVDPAATGDSLLRAQYQAPLYVLLAISGLVLLIACANIANLMLAKAAAREHEMALRLALGATRGRIVRQLLVESLLLAAMGTAAGVMLAYMLGAALIAGIGTERDQVYLSLAPDWRMLAFTTLVALLTCVVFGVAPALQAARTKPGAVMKAAGRAVTEGRQSYLLRRGFIVAQMALSLVLVVTALLFVQTFRNLVNMNTGFEPQSILIAGFDSSAMNLPVERRLTYKRELLDQVRALPGVTAAAETSIVPLSGDGWNDFLDIPEKGVRRKLINFSQVSAEYFRTLEIPVLAGRDFGDSDTVNSPLVAIVNEAFVRQVLDGGTAIGTTFHERREDGKPDAIFRIVGVAGNTKYLELREKEGPIVYVPESQDASPDLGSTMLIRSRLDASSLSAQLKKIAAGHSSEIVLNFSAMRTGILNQLRRERLMASLSGFYGGLAALLATVGLYGIMSYSVARRRTEIGIRMALGATRGRMLGMVMREALTMLGVGVGLGILLVITAGRLVQAMLFGLKPGDPSTLAVAIAGMIAVAVMASLIPAQRAARIQPMQTLREE
jgi:putative ABC transport system permease protein